MQILIDLPGFTPFVHKGCNLAYNSMTGECYRQRGGNYKGKWYLVTPGNEAQGYTQIHFARKPEGLHRIVAQHFLNSGIPLTRLQIVDHRVAVNGTAGQDRLANLRITTARGNAQNKSEASYSRFSGVSYLRSLQEAKKPWRASCSIKGVRIQIGKYQSELEAAAAYIVYLQALGLDTEIAEQRYWGAAVCKS